MRATVDIPDHLRPALLAVVARKGYRGYSRVIAEALEFYLHEKEAREGDLRLLLELRGTWTPEEAEAAREASEQSRTNWQDRLP